LKFEIEPIPISGRINTEAADSTPSPPHDLDL